MSLASAFRFVDRYVLPKTKINYEVVLYNKTNALESFMSTHIQLYLQVGNWKEKVGRVFGLP